MMPPERSTVVDSGTFFRESAEIPPICITAHPTEGAVMKAEQQRLPVLPC